jgi:hypothetical protein
MNRIKYLLFFIALLGIVGWGPFPSFANLFTPSITVSPESQDWVNQQMRSINAQANNLDPHVLKLSLAAYLKARRQGLDHKQLLTIIDYSKPSSERRLWVVDLKNGKVLFNTWVTHGKNSGQLRATSFSNEPGSLKSSIGVFVTEVTPYMGGNGYSLRLSGLEHGINDNAYRRDIVVHGAWYADPTVIRKYGQIGRSWGCPAVSEKTIRPLINTIKDNTLVVAYYPDRHWLNHSTFLTG